MALMARGLAASAPCVLPPNVRREVIRFELALRPVSVNGLRQFGTHQHRASGEHAVDLAAHVEPSAASSVNCD
jgi:hypothetical protein